MSISNAIICILAYLPLTLVTLSHKTKKNYNTKGDK